MQDHIGYDKITQDAMRNVIYRVLKKIEKEGLKGDHHFIINFSTTYSGVVLSKFLLQKFPVDISIIIQHQFKSLVVLENYFKITLSFFGAMETITVPYQAIFSFTDPSVKFMLRFSKEDEIIEETPPKNLKKTNKKLTASKKNLTTSEKVVSLADFKKNRDKKD